METFEEKSSTVFDADDDFDKRCGEIFLTIKGLMIFQCTICEKFYHGFDEFAAHIGENHKAKGVLESNDDDYSDSNIEDNDTMLNYDELNCLEEDMVVEPVKVEDNCVETTPTVAVPVKEEVNCLKTTPTVANPVKEEHNFLKAFKEKQISYKNLKKKNRLKIIEILKFVEDNAIAKKANAESNQIKVRPIRKRTNYFAPEDEVRPLKCDLCDAAFKNPTSYRIHKARHQTEKTHPCPDCDKMFYSPIDVKKHQRFHLGERPFLCNECGRTFITSMCLKKHIRRHTNQRNYECSECKKKFYEPDQLKDHLVVHSSDRPFVCKMCNAAFKRPHILHAHEKLHENKREYKCYLCDAAFNVQAGLYSHMKSKHGECIPKS